MMEAEFMAASGMATELLGVRELFGDLKIECVKPMTLRCDNQTALKHLDGENSSAKAEHIDVSISS